MLLKWGALGWLVRAGLALTAFMMIFVSPSATGEEEAESLLPTRRQVIGQGFHLQLRTRVTLAVQNPNLFQSCRVGLIEHLPKEAFVDPDQTKESERFQGMGGAKLKMLTKPFVDIEKPAASSVPCDYLVEWQDSFLGASFREAQIPFHLRYQAPSKSGFGDIVIEPPIVCSTCELAEFTQTSAEGHNSCATHFGSDFKRYSSKNQAFEKPQIVKVPVGNPEERDLVVYSTVTIVALGTLVILWASFSSAR